MLLALNAAANVVPAKPSAPSSTEEVRKQLAAFLAGGGVGDMKKSPGTLQAVQKRIGAMSDDELAEFKKFIADTPNWRNMPQTMAAAIPPDVLKILERAGADFTARVPAAERMREDIRTLTTVLRMLPDAKLAELGIDRQMLDSLDGTFAELSPLQAAMLQKQITETSGWNAASASAMAALPQAMRQGALALAKHGPLTDEDRKELEQFRTELVDLLGKVNDLRASMAPSAVAEPLQQRIDHIAAARPEVLFMIRLQLPAEKLVALRQNVAILDRVAHLTDRERAALETFRADVVDMFTGLRPAGTSDDVLRDKFAQLSSEQLLMLKDKLAAVPAWKETLPLYHRAMSAPGFAARIAAVRGPAPDAGRLSELRAFRAQALQYIQAAAGEEGVDATLVQRASTVVADADPARLELFRSLAAQMDGMSPGERLKVIANLNLDCTIDFGSLGDISFDFICNPIEDLYEKLFGRAEETFCLGGVCQTLPGKVGMIDKVDDIVGTVGDVYDKVKDIPTKLSEIKGYVDDIDNIYGKVNEIMGYVNDIDDIPGLAWDAIEAALNQLLDVNIRSGISLRDVLNTNSIGAAVSAVRTILRMESDTWWTNIGIVALPSIPCPSRDTLTPFGKVGSDETVLKYNRYKFFIDKIIELIPDTEPSLAIKVAAHTAYTAYELLGVCLEEAAEERASEDQKKAEEENAALLEGRHTSLTSGIGGVSSQVATTTSALSVQLTNSYNALVIGGNAQTNILSSAITAAGAALSNQLTSSTTQLSSQLTSSTTQLSNEIDAEAKEQRALDLRLQIELNLQAGEGKGLVMFQLPAIQNGYLELVRDIVNNAMTTMLAAGQSINQAQKYFNDAQAAISQGRYKEAFKFLQTAYQNVAK
jgi:hypothetical protein